jgi:hypothetical protein
MEVSMKSKRSDINESVLNLISYMKDNVKVGLVQFCRTSKVDISDHDLKRLAVFIDNTIDQSFTNGYSSVQKALDKHSV